MTSEYGLPLSPEQIDQRKREEIKTKYYVRLRPAYIPFFQAMAEDYYQRGKIKAPSISLLAKTCLITAGNAWNRMQIQLLNKENERKVQQHQQDPQNYHQSPQFMQASGNLVPQSVASKRPPPFVVEKTKRRLQQEPRNLVNRLTTERGYPTSTPRLDVNGMTWKPHQHQSQSRPKDQFYYDEDYGALQ